MKCSQRTLSVKTNGNLWGWGDNHDGETGVNEQEHGDVSTPTKTMDGIKMDH